MKKWQSLHYTIRSLHGTFLLHCLAWNSQTTAAASSALAYFALHVDDATCGHRKTDEIKQYLPALCKL